MKHALVAYGVVLVLLLMLVRQFEAAGWTGVGALEVATALVDSMLVLAVVAGGLLAGRLGLERWARSMSRWRREQALAAIGTWPEAEVIGVTSWRQGPRPLPAAPAATAAGSQPQPASQSQPSPTSSSGFTYVGPSFGREAPTTPPFPERPGRRI